MTDRTRRPAGAYLLGLDGPGMWLPGWGADWLERQTNVGERRIAQRGVDPIVDDVLIAVRESAMRWRAASDLNADFGSYEAPTAEVVRRSVGELLGSKAAGDLVGKSDRAVRLACAEGRLAHQIVDGRYVISRDDILAYANYRRTG